MFTRLGIASRIYAGFGLLLIAVAALLGVMMTGRGDVANSDANLMQASADSAVILRASNHAAQAQVAAMWWRADASAGDLAVSAFETEISQVVSLMKQAQQNSSSGPDLAEQADAVVKEAEAFQKAFQDLRANGGGDNELAAVGERLSRALDEAGAVAIAREETAASGRQGALEGLLSLATSAAIAVLVLGAAIAWVVSRSVAAPVSDLTRAVAARAEGAAVVEMPGADRSDEIGELARALSAGDANSSEAELAFMGFNSAETMVMVADADHNITYLNAPLERLFKSKLTEIRSALPNFNPDTLIGSNIDIFHKNPAHQRGLLQGLRDTHNGAVNLGGVDFGLAVRPIFDDSGARVGSVVEWRDITSELHAQNEIAAVVSAANEGDFKRRADLNGAPPLLAKMGEAVNLLAETVDRGISETCDVVGKMANGDLRAHMEGSYQGSFAELKTGINATVDRLANLVADLQVSVGDVSSASNGIASRSGDLASRAESQASSLEETAATMEQMTATIKTNSENAERGRQMALEASERAKRGGEVVGETVSAMSQIEESSAKISDIISVIDGIAFQTNLLALNAAVEAARAGDAGKGFAVVASEVRTLAQRSADAARDIKALISESSEQVAGGVALVSRTGKALTEIVEAIEQVNGTVSDISSASREQAAGVEEISSAVSHMDQMTQQNAAMAEETVASAQNLAQQGAHLSQLIGFFSIDASAAADAQKRRGGGAAHAASPVTAPVAAASAEEVADAAWEETATAAQPAPMARAAGDDWEDF